MPLPPAPTVSSPLAAWPTARPNGSRAGFTLIEIIVVIVVIAVLATLVAPNIFRHVGTARTTTAKTQIETLGAALDAFRLDVGRYPTTAEGLDALMTSPAGAAGWHGPYLKKKVPPDPWGHAYAYKSPGEVNPREYDLVSYGSDGQPGGEDEAADLKSWE
jgi:general secretion pathway protein G